MSLKKVTLRLNIKYGIMQALYWMGFITVYNYAAYFLSDKGFNSSQTGIILAVASILAALLQPPIAAYADKAEESKLKRIILALTSAIVVLTVLIVVIRSYPYLTAILLLLIITFVHTLHSFINSFAMEYANKGIQLNFTIARAAGSLGAAFASFGVGYITAKFGADSVPIIYFAMFLLLIPVTLSFKPAHDVGISSEVIKYAHAPATGVFKFFAKYKKFTGLLIGSTLIFTSHNMNINFLINIVKRLGHGSAELGNVLGIAAIFEVLGMILYLIISKRLKCSMLVQISAVFFTIEKLGILLSKNINHIYASYSLQMFSYAVFVPAAVYYINNLMRDNDRIKGQAYLTTTMTLGGVFGSLLGGTLIDALSIPSMLLIATIISAAGSLLVVVFTEKEKVI